MGPQLTHKERIRDLLAASDAGDIRAAMEFYALDYVDHDVTEGRQGAGGTSREPLENAFRMFRAAFSDTRHAIHDLVEEGDRLAARISVEARHTGPLWGFEPTGRIVRNDSIVIYRFVEGRIRERWCRERRSTRSLLGPHEA